MYVWKYIIIFRINIKMELKGNHQKVAFSRYCTFVPRIDNEQQSETTESRLKMSGLLDYQQLNNRTPVSRHGIHSLLDKEQTGGYLLYPHSKNQRRHSDQGVRVHDVGAGTKLIQRSVSAPGIFTSEPGMIACLDEEQRKLIPSSSDIWRKQRNAMVMNSNTPAIICPCLTQLIQQQVEENRRIQSSSQKSLSYV